MRRAWLSGLWLDCALCALLALLSVVALIYGVVARHPGVAGAGVFGLVGALWVASTLSDAEALRRSRAVREALAREWR